MALSNTDKARLNENEARQPMVYRFLDSILFIVNSSMFRWISLATEKNVIHKFH